MAGWIYVMSNPSFEPGIVKIGKSERDPSLYRKKELETSGVPSAFVVEYQALVENEDEAERFLHETFEKVRVQFDTAGTSRNREFFRIPKASVVEALKGAASVEILFEPQLDTHLTPSKELHTPQYKSAPSNPPPKSNPYGLDPDYMENPVVRNSNLMRHPEVLEWFQGIQRNCKKVVSRIHSAKIAEGNTAYDAALYVKNGKVKREDCQSPEDFYLYLLHIRHEDVVAYQWHFRELNVELRIAQLRKTKYPLGNEQLAKLRGQRILRR